MLEYDKMIPGKIYIEGGKAWGVCAICKHLVRVDKPIFGGLHLCVDTYEGPGL